MKPAKIRPLAETDLVERTRHYGDTGVGELVGMEGLRRVGVDGFPCGWFYIERLGHLDVIRLLADRQDLGALLGDVH